MDIHVDTGNPIAIGATPRVLKLPAGTALFVVRGEVWLTEEGQREDMIMRAGTRYDVRGSGPVVISAVREPTEIYPVPPALAGLSSASHLQAFLTAKAMWLRDAEIERQAKRAGHLLPALLGRLARLLEAPGRRGARGGAGAE